MRVFGLTVRSAGHRALRWLVGSIATVGVMSTPATADIIRVGFDDTALPTLSESEQAKLDTLQTVRLPLILSEVSPDRSTLVVASLDRLSQTDWRVQFLDLNTGELIDSLVLESEVFSPLLPIQWVDNRTIRFVQEGLLGPWDLVSLNRDTGIVSHTSVYPTNEESGEIVGAAPDFSHFALRIFEAEEDIIYLVSLRSLDRIEVARIPPDLDIQPPSWSANGDRVVFVTSAVEERQLYDRTPFSPNLADPVNQDALGRVPPADNLFLQQNAVKVYDLTASEPLLLQLQAGDAPAHLLAEARLNPAGDRLLVKYLEPGQLSGRDFPTYLYPQRSYYRVLDLAGNPLATIDEPTLAGPLENTGDFIDTDTVLFSSTVGTNRHFYTYELATNTLQPLPLPDGSVDPESWSVSPEGNTLFFAFSSVTQPPEVFAMPVDGSAPPRRLTQLNADVAAANQVQVHPVSFTTRNGPRAGFLVQPANMPFPPPTRPSCFGSRAVPALPC